MSKGQKVPISERALFARVDRALNKEGERLKRCREDSGSFHNLGRYYIIDVRMNAVMSSDIDLEKVAREMGVLKGYEALEE